MRDMYCILCETHLGLAESIREHYLPRDGFRKLVKEWRDRVPDLPIDGYEHGKKDAFDLCIYDVEKLIRVSDG